MVEEATICADWRRDRDGRRNAEEDEERRHQEAAADAEQAEMKPTAAPIPKIRSTLTGISAMGR